MLPIAKNSNQVPDGSSLQIIGDIERSVDILCEHSSCETVLCVVGLLNDVVHITELQD